MNVVNKTIFQTSKLGIFTLALSLAGSSASAHSDFEEIESRIQPSSIQGLLSPTRGGYGYVGSSEAEAFWLMNVRCPSKDEQECIASGLCLPPDVTEEMARPLRELGEDVVQAALLHRARTNAYEYLALQLGALTQDRSEALTLPECLKSEKQLDGLFRSLPTSKPSKDELAKMPLPRREIMGKLQAVRGTLSPENIRSAVIFHDYLAASKVTRECSSKPNEQSCASIEIQMQRLRDSMPALFSGTPEKSEARLGSMRSAIQRMLGARTLGGSTEAQLSAGKSFYENQFEKDTIAPSSVDNIEKSLNERLDEAAKPSTDDSDEMNQALSQTAAHLDQTVTSVKDEFAKTIRNSVRGICSLDLRQLTDIAPNVVRQMVVDLPDAEKSLTRGLLCEYGLIDRFKVPPQCGGFKKVASANQTTYQIDQKRSEFPYRSANRYQVTEPHGNSGLGPLVELKVNVASDLPDAEVTRLLGEFRAKTNAWFNCQSGAQSSIGMSGLAVNTTCPSNPAMPRPPVRFRISFQRVPSSSKEKPLIRLSQCYHAELPKDVSTNCEEVRGMKVNRCIEKETLKRRNESTVRLGADQAEKIRKTCEDKTLPAGDPTNNRADSAHYTSTMSDGTLVHEVGHLIGLGDEYLDKTAPFRPLGEHDSIMNASSNPESRLYPRHLELIMAIKRCDANPGSAAASSTTMQ